MNPPPPHLKCVSHYQKVAQEHATRDPVVAYWALYTCVQRSLSIDKSTPAAKAFIIQLLTELEQKKSQLKDNEAITNETIGQAHIENYVIKLFHYADDADRSGVFNKNTIKAFYTSSLLVDVLENFGEVAEEFDRMRKYGKWKAAYVHTCLKNGQVPKSGPVGDEYGEQDEYGDVKQDDAQDFVMPPVVAQPQPLIPVASYQENPQPSTTTPQMTTHSIETLQQAQKYTKFASSALVFDDVATAIENLRKALSILENN